jgi:ubiquinone/menaquinone biosynthesis C-methylase UbiE
VYVIGIDVSTGMLTQAQAAIRKAGITNIETLEADAADLSAARSRGSSDA